MKNYFFSGNQLFIEGKVNYDVIVETKVLEQNRELLSYIVGWLIRFKTMGLYSQNNAF